MIAPRAKLTAAEPLAADAHRFTRMLARIYAARGVRSSTELDLGLARLLAPAQLLNADRAAILLADAIAAGSKLLVIGDFDADGATSTALAVDVLRRFGADACRLPGAQPL